MSQFAANTSVSTEQSRLEIERTLRRYGADGFMYGTQDNMALVAFRMKGRQVKFILTMPSPNEKAFTHSSRGMRPAHVAEKEWEQACRQRWRALALVIKAKLEAVTAGIGMFEDEFLANIVLPDGQLVGQWMRPQIAASYERGGMPLLLPGPSA